MHVKYYTVLYELPYTIKTSSRKRRFGSLLFILYHGIGGTPSTEGKKYPRDVHLTQNFFGGVRLSAHAPRWAQNRYGVILRGAVLRCVTIL